MALLGLYFQPSGRISRRGFWLGIIGLNLIAGAFNAWLDVTLFGHDVFDANAGTLAKPALQLGLLIDLIFAFPLFVLLAKRFHDRNKGAVWTVPFLAAYFAFIAAIIVGWLGIQTPPSQPGAVIALVTLALMVWIVVELGCLRGTPGVNRYGVDPLAR